MTRISNLRSGSVLLTASLGTLLVLADYTAPLTTLAPTARALHAGLTAQTWVLTGMLLGLAALLLTMGSAADDYGRRRVFRGGAALMLLSAALSAAAPDTGVFIAGRVLQGCAGAALLASSLGLVGHAYPSGPLRVRATGIWGASVGLGIAAGPVYAALAERAIGWRSVYWGLALLSAVVLVLAAGVSESRSERRRRLDSAGVATLAAGSACIVAGLAQGRFGWGRADVLVLLVIGVLLLASFVLVESRVAGPMLELSLLRNPGFVASCGGALFTGLAIVGIMSYLPTILELSLGQSPLAASGILAIWSGLSFVVALQARRFASRVRATTQVAGSLLACAAGEAALYGLHVGESWLQVAPGLAIAGIGSGILNAALARLAVASVPPRRSAMGSGANNTFRYIGSSLGVAVVVTVVAQGSSARGHAEALAAGANQAVVVSALLCLAGAVTCALTRVAETRAACAPMPAPGEESAALPHGAVVDGRAARG